MSCIAVETRSLAWLSNNFDKTKVLKMMPCVAVNGNSPVVGSCRSPVSSVVGVLDHGVEVEKCCGSPLRGSNGPKTPRTPKTIRCCRSPRTLGHEIESSNGSMGSPVKAKTSLLKTFSSTSPSKDSLGCKNAASQTIFFGSRLKPVLAVRDVNLLRNEVDSPAKKAVQWANANATPICSMSVREDDEGRGGYMGEIPLNKPPSPPMKRKRPPRLDIPKTTPSTPSLSNEEDQYPKEINAEGSCYAVSCKKGRREIMEDTHKAMVNMNSDSHQAFFGVFDGHGGRKAADFAAENIGHNIVKEIVKMSNGKEDNIVEAVRTGYLVTDSEFLRKDVSGGTCCVTALVRDGNLVVSNAGDCRAVISRNGNAEALTCDHRAEREDERERIENLGGYVDCRHGVWRVQGVLAVSRGIGDLHMKEWISAEPDTKKIQITSDCEFLILASDGLWDKVTDQEAVDLARPIYSVEQPSIENNLETGKVLVKDTNTMLPSKGPLVACKKLVDLSIARGSLDDVSVMIVQLGQFCKKKQ